MPSRCSRRSAAAFSVGLAVGLTTAPSRAFVTGWVAPAGQLRVGRGIVRQRSSPVGSPSTSCRCGGVSSATSESGHEWKEVENNPTIIGDQDRLRSFWRGEHKGVEGLKQAGISMLAGLFIMAGGAGGGGVAAAVADGSLVEPTSSVTVQDLQRYDGFEDYAAQGQQMENSDVGCFANECKKETASCFTDGSCLKVSFETNTSPAVYLVQANHVARFVPKQTSAAVFVVCSCMCSLMARLSRYWQQHEKRRKSYACMSLESLECCFAPYEVLVS